MSKKSIHLLIGTLISWSLGIVGGDRFFKGEMGLGVLKLVTFGGLGVWYFIDAVIWTRELGASLK
jgi:TM2 domain-containing membrane protein YozV